MKKSLITMIAALALVGVVGAGATLAYLTSTTDVVKNTFTIGDVEIKLTEKVDVSGADVTGNNYTDVLPGSKLFKQPKVTVAANSVDCYVFVKVVNNLEGFVDIEKKPEDCNWTKLEGVEDVYYMEVKKSAEKQEFVVFDGVVVSEEITEDFKGADSIEITSYAVQKGEMADAMDAWTKANFQ